MLLISSPLLVLVYLLRVVNPIPPKELGPPPYLIKTLSLFLDILKGPPPPGCLPILCLYNKVNL